MSSLGRSTSQPLEQRRHLDIRTLDMSTTEGVLIGYECKIERVELKRHEYDMFDLAFGSTGGRVRVFSVRQSPQPLESIHCSEARGGGWFEISAMSPEPVDTHKRRQSEGLSYLMKEKKFWSCSLILLFIFLRLYASKESRNNPRGLPVRES